MTTPASRRAQRGVTLAVGLIMLFVITVMVVAAFKLSTLNLAAAGNAQFREQAIAAANLIINSEADGPFENGSVSGTPPSLSLPDRSVDIDGDGNNDFLVHFNSITCVRATEEGAAATSSVTLPTSMTTSKNFNTVWDFDVTVSDATAGATGTGVRIHEGVGVRLTQARCDAICPAVAGTPCS
jgi:Tfp pilus assembly protein PilX